MDGSSEVLACNGRMPRQRKRVVTEARKEQNRLAQRAYRRRQREERLKQLQAPKVHRYPLLRPLPTLQDPSPYDPIPPVSSTSALPLDIDLNNPDLLHQLDEATRYTLHEPEVEPSVDSLDVMGIDPFFTFELVPGHQNSISDRQNRSSGQSPLIEGILELDGDLNHAMQDEGWDGVRQLALADIYLNRLQSSKATLLQAFLFNARCLGIGAEEFSSYSCLSFCSPFYRPVTMSDDPKALLAAVSRPSTPPHLQPTLPQVLFPHHPILDLLPLPELRARAIMLAATAPFLLDGFDFKKDVVEGGLICWAARRGGNSQPWDKRNWEAAPWFLRKWRLLVDGPQSELWQQSAWWQGMRGEVPAR